MQGYKDNTILQVRTQFADMLLRDQFVGDNTGARLLEIQGASFIANEPAIFGTVNEEYAAKEIAWYRSMSLNVNDIPGSTPSGWLSVADKHGNINSNYGWTTMSDENYKQFENVLWELYKNRESRRGVMIYNRPSMWQDYKSGGKNDFMCTNTVQYLVRDGYLDVVVQMRSNDVFWGYRNDYHWQLHVQEKLLSSLNALIMSGIPADIAIESKIELGTIYWQAGSLHVYERDFYLVDWFEKTGQTSVKKSIYRETYPDSPWSV